VGGKDRRIIFLPLAKNRDAWKIKRESKAKKGGPKA
jgi:hypothetical protein